MLSRPCRTKNPVAVCRSTDLRAVGFWPNCSPFGLIQLGILVLIATPIARVGFSIYGFWLERDRLYVAITWFVLLLLLVGFLT